MNNLFDKIHEFHLNGCDLVSVFVTEKSGSGPVNIAKKMVITNDGQACGTVGGGAIEFYAREKCAEILKNKKSLNERYYLSETQKVYLNRKQLPMACGGEVTLFYEYYPVNDSSLSEIYSRIDDLRQKGHDMVLATITECEGVSIPVGTKILLDEDGTLYNEPADEEIRLFVVERATESLKKRAHATFKFEDGKKKATVFFEFIGPRQYVYIFGGGHCGQALARVLRPLGFYLIVVDDRQPVIDAFDSAHQKIKMGFVDFIANYGIKPMSLVVVCTPSHTNDYHVLNKIIEDKIQLTYFGMLCSKSKLKDYIEATYAKHGCDIDLSNFYSPIGLKLGDNSPEDIAISIAAEMLEVISGMKESKHMRDVLDGEYRYWEH